MGDAILATRVVGDELADVDAEGVDDAVLDRVWAELGNLHAAAIAHGTLDSTAIRIDGDGTVQLGAFVRGEPVTRMDQVHADRAQLLVTTALTVGPERAINAALRAITEEPDAVTSLVANLQAAAFDEELRRSVAKEKLSLKDLREATAAAAGIDVPELQKVRARRRQGAHQARRVGRRRLHPHQPARRHRLRHHRRRDPGGQPPHPPGRAGARPDTAGGAGRVAPDGISRAGAAAPGHQAHVRHLLHQPGGPVERGPGRDEHPVLPAVRGHRRPVPSPPERSTPSSGSSPRSASCSGSSCSGSARSASAVKSSFDIDPDTVTTVVTVIVAS